MIIFKWYTKKMRKSTNTCESVQSKATYLHNLTYTGRKITARERSLETKKIQWPYRKLNFSMLFIETYLISGYIFCRHCVSASFSVIRRRVAHDLSRERISLQPWEPSIRHKHFTLPNHLAIITARKIYQKHKHNKRPIVWSRN